MKLTHYLITLLELSIALAKWLVPCVLVATACGASLSISDLSIVEGTKGAVTVTLSPPSTARVSVSWSAINGSAGGKDFWTTSTGTGSLRFNSGETIKTIPVTAIADNLAEGKETFTLRIARPYGAKIIRSTAMVTISDGDEPLPPPDPTPPPDPVPPPPDQEPTPSPTNLFNRPFRDGATWNSKIDGDAKYGPRLGDRYVDMRRGYVNCAQHSVVVLKASATDIVRNVRTTEGDRPGTYQMRLPNNAAGSAGSGSDQHLVVFDADSRTIHEFYKFPQGQIGGNVNITAGAYHRTDATANGWPGTWIRATGCSCAGGLVRVYDVQQGVITHKLCVALPRTVLSKFWQPPADRKDGGLPQGQGNQTGEVNYGAVVGIPRTTNINALGLSSGGVFFAKALQEYGAYVVDTSETWPPVLYAEQALGGNSLINAATQDAAKLMSNLSVVTSGSGGW